MSVQSSSRPQTATSASASVAAAPPSEAAAKLAEAIDDFLGDVEKKFKSISDEILTKLDDMAERCDRLEQEMLMRDAGSSKSTLGSSGVSLDS
ncbi:hypothetical protein LTS08_003997 [Lithohypha guttulata]|uniref:Heat shock factor binding protein 1 n=1 Tax=Lithohypha guttulata TaxID=1690604 RepID=A0AAN7SY59_9EURO|nr:hypothetical protein LTR05_006301 [Lithohypha guttulata]KAK5103192.1 hypothetical protein LTS08_003997 [Lithohypha guttulata]